LEGWYGEFKTASSAGTKTNNAVFLGVGEDFTFGYDIPDEVLETTGVEEETDKSSVVQKLFKDPWAARNNPSRSSFGGRRRNLEDDVDVSEENPDAEDVVAPAATDNAKKLFNPVLCMQEGDAVFFNVDSKKKQYPIYAKDSILNTNSDFDFGPFETLADMINR